LVAARALDAKDERLKRPAGLCVGSLDEDRDAWPLGGGGGGNVVIKLGFGEILECTRESGRGNLAVRFPDGVSGETVVAALVGVLYWEGFDPGETVSDGEIVVLLGATKP